MMPLPFCLPRGQPSTRSLRGRGDSDPSVVMLPHSRHQVARLNGRGRHPLRWRRIMGSESLRPQAAQCLRDIVAETACNPALHVLLTGLLAQPGRVLAPEGPAKWLRFVVEPCDALGGDLASTPYAVAAVECVLAAADVVDDVVDGDWDHQRSPVGCGVNASLALSHLAQRALDQLALTCAPQRLARIRSALSAGVLQACAGEDLDLRFENRVDVGVEQAHTMTSWKSGSLVAMACTVGAALATDDAVTLNAIATFGTHVGVIAQLLNDSAALTPQEAALSTDLQRRKKTLPISFALHYAQEAQQHDLLRWAESTHPLSAADCAQLATAIAELGGLHYAWVVADTHRREALATLRMVQRATGRRSVWTLRQLIPQLRARRVHVGAAYA